MLISTNQPRTAVPTRAASKDALDADWGCPTIQDICDLARGASGAVVGSAILGAGSVASSVANIPHALGQVWDDWASTPTENCGDVFMKALAPVTALPILFTPITSGVLGIVIGAIHGAYEGHDRGLGAAAKAAWQDVKVIDKVNKDFHWGPNY